MTPYSTYGASPTLNENEMVPLPNAKPMSSSGNVKCETSERLAVRSDSSQ